MDVNSNPQTLIHPFNFQPWRDLDVNLLKLEHKIQQYEKYLDEYIGIIEPNHETLNSISVLTGMLNDMYSEYDSLLFCKATICN